MFVNFIIYCISALAFVVMINNIKLLKIKKVHLFYLFVILLLILYIMPVISVTLIMPTILISMIVFFSILKNSVINSIMSAIIVYLISSVVDFSSGYLFLNIFKIKTEDLFANEVLYLTLNIVIFIGSYLLSNLIGKYLKKYKHEFLLKTSSKKITTLLLINLISAFLIMYIFAISIKLYIPDSTVTMAITIISAIYFLSSFVVIFFYGKYIKKDMELQQKAVEAKQLQEYTDMIEHMYNDMRKFKHDYVNLLATINGYIECKDISGLKDFFNKKIIPMSNKINYSDSRLSALQYLKIAPIKGLLSSKVVQAQKKELDVLVDIAENIDVINIDVLDLSRIIGIIFDNAIEASQLSEEKKLRLAFVKRGNSVIIIISNSFSENIPPIHKMFMSGFSTKGDSRGLGLANVKQIIGIYNNMTLNTFIENNEFTQEINIIN